LEKRELEAGRLTHWDGFTVFNVVVTLLLVFALLAPSLLSREWLEQHVDVCPLRRAGVTCPSCGITRSILALYAGDLGASRAFHPMGVWLVAGATAELFARPMVMAMARRGSRVVSWVDLVQLCLVAALTGLAIGGR